MIEIILENMIEVITLIKIEIMIETLLIIIEPILIEQ